MKIKILIGFSIYILQLFLLVVFATYPVKKVILSDKLTIMIYKDVLTKSSLVPLIGYAKILSPEGFKVQAIYQAEEDFADTTIDRVDDLDPSEFTIESENGMTKVSVGSAEPLVFFFRYP